MAALEAGPESRGEGYTNPPESSIDPSIPVPFPHSLLHHFLTQPPPTYPRLSISPPVPVHRLSLARSFSFSLPSFSFFLSVSRMTSHVSPEKLTRALRLPYPLQGSFRVLLASVDFQGNSFPTPFPLAAHLSIYLSICVSFSVPSYLPIPLSIYSPVSLSFSRLTFVLSSLLAST